MGFQIWTTKPQSDSSSLGEVEQSLVCRRDDARDRVVNYTRLSEHYAARAQAAQIEVDALKAALEKLGVNTD